MNVDTIDLKILSQLDYDARQSYSAIGKKIGRSKQFVGNRIKSLKEKGIITGYIIDTDLREIGYTVYCIFFQFQNVDKEKESKIIKYIVKSKYVGYFLKTLGNWDIFISVKAEGINDFYNFLGDFHKHCLGLIKKESINLEIKGIDTNLKFLSENKINYIYLSVNAPQDKKKEFNEIERKIFVKLREDPIIPYVNLAEQMGRSYITIKKIIKNLKEKRIIKRTKAVINTERLGYTRYLFLIELSFPSNKEMEELLNYIKNHNNISYIIESIGSWNLICDTYFRDIYELMETIDELKGKFGHLIHSIEFLRVIKNEKESFNF